MQTLQCITSSLNDRAALQKLRANLEDLPKRFLSRVDKNEDYLLGTIHGDCNFHFTFRLEGGGFFQTGVLVASAENVPGGLPVPLKCKWKRRIGDLHVEIPGVTSNMYQISADDIGTDICVEARPADLDDGLQGTVQGEIGPFELDPATRHSLDNALGNGGSKFSVMQHRPTSADASPAAGRGLELAIHVSAEGVKVVPLQGGAEKTAKELFAAYSPDYPRVIIHPLDTSKFQLVMSESRTFQFIATSRTSRDLIALTIRCFHARKYSSTQQVLQLLLPVQPLGPGTATAPTDNRLDGCILLERLTKELNRSMQQKEVSEKVLRNTHNEKKELQAQLMETITGFTEVIEGLQAQAGDGYSAANSAEAQRKQQEHLRETMSQNQALEAESQSMRKEIDRIYQQRTSPDAVARDAKAKQKAKELREERQLLQARLKELSSSTPKPAQKDQADQVHAHELKRLRQDVEMLHNQKEELREQLQLADQERTELQENFLYVKGQLDKVQMKQAHAANNGNELREIQKHRQTLEAITEERNRFSTRLESLLREIEKEKAYHEQSLERVMTANARLIEERDAAQKAAQRVSRLYAESVQELQKKTMESGVLRPEDLAAGGDAADPEELGSLRARIAEADALLKQREQENESLKNRIRKLAVS